MNLTAAIQELEQKCSSLQQQNGELNDICHRAQSDHRIATEVAHKVQEELAILLIAHKSLQSEDCVKAEIIEKLKNEVKTLEERIQNSKEDNILLVRQNQDGTRQLADFEAQLKELKVTLSQTSAAHASVVDRLAEKERSNELLNQEISGLHAQIVALNTEISSRTSHEHGLVDQINVLKEKGVSLSADLGECSMRKNHLEVQVEELNQACLAEKEENKALLLKQQKYLDEIATMKMNLEELQKNLHHLTGERLLLLGEAAAHLKQQKDMKQTISGLESNVEVMKGENLSLKDQLVKAQEEKKITVEDNQKAKLEIHDLLCRLSDLDGRNTDLLSEVQNKERDISTLEAEIGLLRNTSSSLAKEVALLQEDKCS
jgi:chromosome segregation ATPase